jgi:histidinol-phosphate aminotransferase
MTAPRVKTRDAYREVRAYNADVGRFAIELADNTSPCGAPPSALRALREVGEADLVRYPTTYSRPLRDALARYIGVACDEIMIGAGSDEVMSCAFRALAEPGDSAAYMHPTFVMTSAFAQTNSLVPTPVPLTDAHDADGNGLLQAHARITYLCSPNNPTGVLVARDTVDRVMRDAPGAVMIDEAYAEYAGTNLAAEAPARDGVLVLRTLSKAFGLAGLRVGYAVGARSLIAELEKARGPYAVTSASEHVACAVVAQDIPWVQERAQDVRGWRDWFVVQLAGLGFAPLPSSANFVLVPVANATALGTHLRSKGILVREFTNLPHIGDALRISIAPPAVMRRVLDAMSAGVTCA